MVSDGRFRLAGLDARAVSWLHDRRVAVLGSGGVSDAIPNTDAEGWPMPIHQCGIVAMGLHLLDNLRLDELAAACAERQRWEFFLVIAPLRVKRGTGSAVNPVAIFLRRRLLETEPLAQRRRSAVGHVDAANQVVPRPRTE